MSELYVTIEEAAKFEGMSYKGFISRVARHPEVYRIKTESASSNGGKKRVHIALSSLSKKARMAHKKATNINIDQVITEERTSPEKLPWYVECDFNAYMQKNSKQYYQAVDLARSIREFLNYADKDRTGFAASFAASIGISQRTLYRHAESYLEASAWAMRLSKQDGKDYDFLKVLALCRKPKQKFTFPSLSPECKAFIENLWFDKTFAANNGTIDMVYSRLMKVASANSWDYPSYPTVARYIGYLMDELRGGNARFLAARGLREYKNHVMVKASRNTKALPVMGLVQGDAHTLDVWVKYTHPNGKVTAIRPKLVAWLDTRSRCIVGDVICVNPNAQILKQSLLNMMYSGEVRGVPQWLLIDNGKDYTAESMTGRKRNDRVSFDSETKGFYRSIGIQDDIRSLPYQPWSKGQIERFFGTMISKFEKWLASYTGTLTGSRTASKVNKDIDKMLERGELLSMEELYQCWKEFKDEYHSSNHSGLKRQGEKWLTPIDVFRNAEERYVKPAPPKSYATVLMMKAERVRVYNIGIKKFGYEYRADELTDYIGDKVDIKWDADDVTRLYVYTKDGKRICEAVSQELLLIAPKVQQKALEEHMRSQKLQIKRDTAKGEYFRTPLEERISEYNQSAGEVAGFMIQNENSAPTKVVSLPADQQYKEDVKSRKTKRNPEVELYEEKAAQALEVLRRLAN